jgi:hypothetical protein
VNFSEQPPSKQWAALKYRGEKYAEVWFKPEGEPFGLTFRIPQKSFQTPGVGERLTTEILLKTVGIATEEVESWRHGDLVSHSGMNGSHPELNQPLLQPSQDATDLNIYVSLKRPPEVDIPEESGENESSEPGVPSAKWDELEARWNVILGVETSIDTLRLALDSARLELEAAWNKQLTPEEKLHALNADVAQWTKAKNRVHYVVPKVKEFVHRATWAMGSPERKKLEKLFEDDVRPEIPVAEISRVPEQLENLLKDRQVLAAQGSSVHQECKNISAAIQAALNRLQMNAARIADRKRRAAREGGKFFKSVRRWSGAGP